MYTFLVLPEVITTNKIILRQSSQQIITNDNYQIMHKSPRNVIFIFVSVFKTTLVTYKLHIFLSNSVSPLYAYIVD